MFRPTAVVTLLLLAVAAAGGATFYREPVRAMVSPDCTIRGNVSQGGERIYHLPGQRYYDATTIKPWRGERWFCSETEARDAGWRRART